MSKIICIDPGHGGADSGAAANGWREKDLTLSIAWHLGAFLDADAHYTTLLTRTADTGLDVNSRSAIGNNARADLFLSIHMNAGGGSGFEAYPHVPNEIFHGESRGFAEAAAQAMADLIKPRGIGGIRYAYNKNGSKVFAESNDKNPGGYTTYFGVVRGSTRPAVLLETAFIDSKADQAVFDTDAKRKAIAARYYRAVCGFFGSAPLFDTSGSALGPVLEKQFYKINRSFNGGKWNADQKGAYEYSPDGLKAALADYIDLGLPAEYKLFDPRGGILFPNQAGAGEAPDETGPLWDEIMKLQAELKETKAQLESKSSLLHTIRALLLPQ